MSAYKKVVTDPLFERNPIAYHVLGICSASSGYDYT